MEKFRHFGDAGTGIHPYTFVIAPTTAGRIGAICMFPMRLLLSSLFALLLLVTDTLLWVCHVTYVGLLGRLLLAPLQRAWLRALLFFMGHIVPEQPAVMARPAHPAASEGTNSWPRAARGGDLVVCNLQSVWDALVLEVMLAQPYHAVCFPDATAAGAVDGNAGGGVRVFWPGPLQRWRVWAFTRHTGALDYLSAQLSASASGALPVHRVQAAAVRAGVPVWWFGEGTCSNGRGLLPMPPITCSSAAAASLTAATAAGCVVHLATVQYNSPALQNVLGDDVEGVFGALLRTGLLLYGSTAPAWSSPFFPTAEVTYRTTRLTRATAAAAAAAAAATASSPSGSAPSCWTLSAPALLELRNAMCQRGQALVVSGSAGAVRRQPLTVGLKEKKGFVEAYAAMLASQKAKSSA